MANLQCEVLTPNGRAFAGEGKSVEAQAVDGRIGILPRHVPLITALGKGTLRIVLASGGEKKWQLDGGFLEVLENHVSIAAERISEG
jgi:F-type H+-transporting ATPase subunit epsilon